MNNINFYPHLYFVGNISFLIGIILFILCFILIMKHVDKNHHHKFLIIGMIISGLIASYGIYTRNYSKLEFNNTIKSGNISTIKAKENVAVYKIINSKTLSVITKNGKTYQTKNYILNIEDENKPLVLTKYKLNKSTTNLIKNKKYIGLIAKKFKNGYYYEIKNK